MARRCRAGFFGGPIDVSRKLVYEKWCIERLSSHYKTGAALDDESIKNLRDAQHFLSGLKWCRFIGMALYDLEIHSQDHEVEVGTETETIYKMAYGGMNGSFNLRNLWYEIMSKIAFQGVNMKSMIRLCRRLGITLSLATMRDIMGIYILRCMRTKYCKR